MLRCCHVIVKLEAAFSPFLGQQQFENGWAPAPQDFILPKETEAERKYERATESSVTGGGL